MRRPAIITAIAYVQLLAAVDILKAFDSPYRNRIPLFTGSALSVHAQWTLLATLLPAAVIIGAGFAPGKGWSRWLLAATIIVIAALTVPIRQAQGIYSYLLLLLLGVTLATLPFSSGSSRAYFDRTLRVKRALSLRGLFAKAMFAFCAVNTSLILRDRLMNNVDLLTAIAVLCGLSLPALVLGAVARWDIVAACRNAATALLSAALFVACRFLFVTTYVYTSDPETFPVTIRNDSLIFIGAIAVLGLMLARISANRALKAQSPSAAQ